MVWTNVKIQIDVDGVLADFQKGASTIAHSIDSSIPIIDEYHVKSWDWDWPEEVCSKVWMEIKTRPYFWYDLPSLLSRDEWMDLRRLMTPTTNEVYFVTARPGVTSKWQTEGWLFDRLERSATVVVTADKAGFAKLVKPDYAIEDNAVNAYKIGRIIGESRSCIMDRLYNQELHCMSAKRVYTFQEFLETIR